jgi:hypothetical protein
LSNRKRGRWAATGLMGLMLCVPPGAWAQVGEVEIPQLPQVTVPPVVPLPPPPEAPTAPTLPAPPTPPPTVSPAAPYPGLPVPSGSAAVAAAGSPATILERAMESVPWWVGDAGGDDGGSARDRGSAPDRKAARAERRARRARERRVRRRLRRVVERHRECRFVLTGRERRILRLHLGLGDYEARSRRAVARRLDTSSRRIRRIERRAVRKLRRADRSGICDAPAMTLMNAGTGAGGLRAVLVGGAGVSMASTGPSQESGGVLGARESGDSRDAAPDANRGGGDGATRGGYRLADPDSGLVTLAWVAAAAAALMLLAGVLRLWQRRAIELPGWLKRSGPR